MTSHPGGVGWRRRDLLAVAAAAWLPGPLHAGGGRPNGAFGMICSPHGVAGILFEGEDGAALAPGWRWHIGSNTKAMTALLYARMVERGRCRWGASVASLFPSVAAHPAWSAVGVEDLLSHAAGLADGIVDGDWLRARRADPAPARVQRQALAARLLAAPPTEAPGTYRYGNLNYVMVGAAIEAAADAAWEDVVRRELFAPLGIAQAGFGAPRSGLWGRAAQGDALVPIDPAGVADNPAILWPSGGVNIAPADYAQFLATFLCDEARYVRPATLERLLTPSRAGLRYAGGWSLEGPQGARADTLEHNGSNTFWFAAARVERGAARAYAAVANAGGRPGAATVARITAALRGRGG